MRHELENVKFPGEVTPRRAARLLGVHQETTYRWCKEAVEEGRGKFAGFVRKSVVGWYYIRIEGVSAVLDECQKKPYGPKHKV